MIETKYSIVCGDYDAWHKYMTSFSNIVGSGEVYTISQDLKNNWNGTLQIRYASELKLSQLEIVFDDRESYMEFVLTWS